jgi:glucuronate isomerase
LDANNIDLQKFEESVKRAKDANQEDHSTYDPDLLEGLTERSAYFKRMKSN